MYSLKHNYKDYKWQRNIILSTCIWTRMPKIYGLNWTQRHTQLLIKENWEKWISVFQTPLPPFFQEAPPLFFAVFLSVSDQLISINIRGPQLVGILLLTFNHWFFVTATFHYNSCSLGKHFCVCVCEVKGNMYLSSG